jgi:hypothetical protein
VNGAHGSDWSDEEVELIVADYFAMLSEDLEGQAYRKAEHNQALQTVVGRSRKAIEFKHCNISAVLERLGMRGIPGYKPLHHYQNALIDAVDRYLSHGAPVLSYATGAIPTPLLKEEATLWVGPPPLISVAETKETDRLRRLIQKFDPAERDARNRKLGKLGEELVLRHEESKLILAGRADLARKVEWTSVVRGDGAGYDIRSFEPSGDERLIEVKTTNGPAKTPFFISENERCFSEEQPGAFRLLRLYAFTEKPSAYELKPPLSDHLALNAATYRASLI